MYLKFHFCLNAEARVWVAPSAIGFPGAQDSWLQVSLEVQFLMQVTMGFGNSGV